jgi:uncharacterized tellurite resistance protein B-like protein
MNEQSKRAMISDLIVLALADNKVTDTESDLIYQLAERMDVSKREVNDLFVNPLPSAVLITELDRISHFYKLVLLMNVDMETHEKEVIAVRRFGLKMGIRPGVIDQILTRMDAYENKIIPSDELINIFRTYYN